MLLSQITNSPAWWQFLSYSKDSFASLESIFKVLAIIVAGIWAWMLFVRKREKYPKAKLEHDFQIMTISDSHKLLRVTLRIMNVSDVLLCVRDGHTWVQQMKPWPEELIANAASPEGEHENQGEEIPWPLLKEHKLTGERELEPQESDNVVMDFVLDSGIEKVLVYSFVENCRKPGRHLGWTDSSVVNLQDEGLVEDFWFSDTPRNLRFSSRSPVDAQQSQSKKRPGDAKPLPHSQKGKE